MDQHLDEKERLKRFEAQVLPHLDAAYNLARWLSHNAQDAEDLTQMACVRAFRFFDGFQGGDARAWLLTIVRNAYYNALRDDRHERHMLSLDEGGQNGHAELELAEEAGSVGANPETLLIRKDTGRLVNQALQQLPLAFREVLVLKEMAELSYKEIADVVGVPIGTVMSRLARARKLLLAQLKDVGEMP